VAPEESDSEKRDQQARKAILCEQPVLVGEIWAQTWFKTLRAEGRPVSGGWPGTMQEARHRAKAHCDRELGLRGLPPLSQAELTIVTTVLYERAKRDWLGVVREGAVRTSNRSEHFGQK
jgi:hypothetical protein